MGKWNPNEISLYTNYNAIHYLIYLSFYSFLAWHPITISSAPSEPITTHHIKAMGSDQWTARLRVLAAEKHLSQSSLQVNIDGPDGSPLPVQKYTDILLIAGGIGVTPLMSCYKQLYVDICNRSLYTLHIRKIRLVWVLKRGADINLFKETVCRIYFFILHLS